MINTPKLASRLLCLAVPLALLLGLSANLHAQQAMSISLNGGAEVPPVKTSATGSGQLKVLPDHTVNGSIKVSGMQPTMAHIHEAAAGKNGPPIITLSKTGSDSFTVPSDAKLTDAQYTSYTAGNLYVNVHSAEHPNGELRAQLPRPESAGMPMRPAY
ncbi:MAG: CHRD domain-containing protein [Rhodocyclaceae bacterium]